MIQLLIVSVNILLLRSSDGVGWDVNVTFPLEVILRNKQHEALSETSVYAKGYWHNRICLFLMLTSLVEIVHVDFPLPRCDLNPVGLFTPS